MAAQAIGTPIQAQKVHDAHNFQSPNTLPMPSIVSRTSVVPLYPVARHAPLLALPTMLTRL
jgi:hypothetical protein